MRFTRRHGRRRPDRRNSLAKKEKRQIRKIARNIANRLITRRAPGLSVANAQNADSAKTVADEAITTEKIAKDAVSNEKLADNSVSNTKLADNSVSNSKLADNSVSNTKLADNSVSNTKIAGGAVTQAKVGANAIGAAQLKNLISRTKTESIPNSGSEFINVPCSAGEQVIGVGSIWGTLGAGLYLNYAKIFSSSAQARGNNFSGSAANLTAEAYCLPQ